MYPVISKINAWYGQQKSEGTFNIRYLILWFMVAIFPLLAIPHPFSIKYLMGVIDPNPFYLPRYIILGIVALFALFILLKDRIRIKHPAFIPLCLFIIFATTSAILAPIQVTAWIGSPLRFTGLTTYYFCIILFILAQTTEKIASLLTSLVVSGSLVSILAILQFFGIDIVPHQPYQIFSGGMIGSGTMPHPNFLGTYTAFILPAAIFIFLRARKPYFILFPILIYIGLLVSLCRGTWLASIIGLLIVLYYVWNKPVIRKRFLILLGAFMLVSLLIIPIAHGALLARILSLKDSTGLNLTDSAGSYRMYIWRGAFHLFLLYWPFGIGPDHLIYVKLITPAHQLADKVHNIYLEMGLTMGVFTLLSYLTFLSFFFRKWKTETGFILITMFTVYLIQGFTNIDVVPIMPLFWIVLGFTLSEKYEMQISNMLSKEL